MVCVSQFHKKLLFLSLVSSLSCTTGLEGEGRSASVAGEEDVDRLPLAVESGRTATPG